MSLGTQPPTIEARLAVAALIGGNRDEAQIHLARAAGSARSTVEYIAVVEAMLRGLGSQDERRWLMTKAVGAAKTIIHLADVAIYRLFLMDDATAGAETIRSCVNQAPATLALAQLLLATRAPTELLEKCVVSIFAKEAAQEVAVTVAAALGAQSSVVARIDQLGGADQVPSSWLVAADAWRALGQGGRAKVLEDRWTAYQKALSTRLAAARAALMAVGYHLPAPPSPLTEDAVKYAEWLGSSPGEVGKVVTLATRLQASMQMNDWVANYEAVKRILAFAAGTMPLEASAKYVASGLADDIVSVQGSIVEVRRVSSREWDEEVVEQVPTGETKKTFFGLRETPVMREVRRTVRRRGPEEERWVLMDYFGREVPASSIHARDADRKIQGGKPVIVRVRPGKFLMGAGADDRDAPSAEKQHEVVISRGFEILSVPVTQAQYVSVMPANPSSFKGLNRPVENVSWFDAVKYCNALSRAQGLPEAYELSGSGDTTEVKWRGLNQPGWRLPTEAEWEYACRAGTKGPRYGPVDEVAWYAKNAESQTRDVGMKKPNPWGLYDMLGNAWEWVWDWSAEYGKGTQVDPVGPGAGSDRVIRGGCWHSGAQNARAASRSSLDPSRRRNDLGFRPTRSLTK